MPSASVRADLPKLSSQVGLLRDVYSDVKDHGRSYSISNPLLKVHVCTSIIRNSAAIFARGRGPHMIIPTVATYLYGIFELFSFACKDIFFRARKLRQRIHG